MAQYTSERCEFSRQRHVPQPAQKYVLNLNVIPTVSEAERQECRVRNQGLALLQLPQPVCCLVQSLIFLTEGKPHLLGSVARIVVEA